MKAIDGIKKRLAKRTPDKKLLFIGELKANTREFVPKMVSLLFSYYIFRYVTENKSMSYFYRRNSLGQYLDYTTRLHFSSLIFSIKDGF